MPVGYVNALAERVGFEPTVGVNPHLLSREAQSAVLCHLSRAHECSGLPVVDDGQLWAHWWKC